MCLARSRARASRLLNVVGQFNRLPRRARPPPRSHTDPAPSRGPRKPLHRLCTHTCKLVGLARPHQVHICGIRRLCVVVSDQRGPPSGAIPLSRSQSASVARSRPRLAVGIDPYATSRVSACLMAYSWPPASGEPRRALIRSRSCRSEKSLATAEKMSDGSRPEPGRRWDAGLDPTALSTGGRRSMQRAPRALCRGREALDRARRAPTYLRTARGRPACRRARRRAPRERTGRPSARHDQLSKVLWKDARNHLVEQLGGGRRRQRVEPEDGPAVSLPRPQVGPGRRSPAGPSQRA